MELVFWMIKFDMEMFWMGFNFGGFWWSFLWKIIELFAGALLFNVCLKSLKFSQIFHKKSTTLKNQKISNRIPEPPKFIQVSQKIQKKMHNFINSVGHRIKERKKKNCFILNVKNVSLKNHRRRTTLYFR